MDVAVAWLTGSRQHTAIFAMSWFAPIAAWAALRALLVR